jgi:antitoxin component YwqK of YwqJK toxin-antitoxin module
MARPSEPVAETAYYPTGAVRYKGLVLDGESHGAWEFFRLDGSVMRAGTFDRGRQIGIWRTFDRSGRLVKETTFAEGETRS